MSSGASPTTACIRVCHDICTCTLGQAILQCGCAGPSSLSFLLSLPQSDRPVPKKQNVVQGALQPVNAAVWSSLRQVASFVSNQSDLKFQIPQGASSWLLNTYLDKVTILACCQNNVQGGSGLSSFVKQTLFPGYVQLNRRQLALPQHMGLRPFCQGLPINDCLYSWLPAPRPHLCMCMLFPKVCY